MEINVHEILNLKVAISDKQADLIKKVIDYDKQVILNFAEITDVTTAFMNVIMDGFMKKNHIKKASDVLSFLKFRNANESVKFAFGDAYELFKKRFK